jgi:HEAT repeat protein
VPLFGPPNVQKMKAKGDTVGLQNALTFQKDPSIRRDAAIALGEIGGYSVENYLIPLLEDNSQDVRTAALDALRMLLDRGVTDWWALEFHTKHYFGNAEKIGLLLVDNESVVAPIFKRLDNMNSDDLDQAKEDMKPALMKVGKSAVGPLIAATKYERFPVRNFAIEMLGLIGDPQAVEPIRPLLNDRMSRQEVILALGRIGDMRAFEAIVQALMEDGLSQRRASAAEALGRLGDQRAIAPLTQALFDVDPEPSQDLNVREKAALALDTLGWQPPFDSTGAAYWAAKHEWDKCADLGVDAVEPLIYALSATGPYTKPYIMDVVRALKRVGTEAIVSRLDCINSWPPRFQSDVKEQLLHYGVL